ncbi:baseplate J/gp47 family protein [Sulfitobacter sp. 1A15106]|uniref:baseplate assembly protein n=1 Tax=Sulfitobacter sp. 1A15106 TaxID=3368590 RepID=UPI0037465D9F
MSRFSSSTLDLSRFPAPLAIRGLDYEAILAERLAGLQSRFDAAGLEIDALGLESEPAVIIEQSDAYRELLALSAVNDAVRDTMIAFAGGADLDHLAAFYGVMRRVITEATNSAPAVMETDAELRRRTLLAPEAFSSAGAPGGYVFHALGADTRVLNVDVWSPMPGHVNVAVQSREGDGAAPDDLLDAVRAHLSREDIKPLTDILSVRSVVNVPYDVVGTGYVLPGPDALAVRDQTVESIKAMAAQRRTPSRDLPRSAVIDAASVGAMDKVIVSSPAADIARDYGEVAVLNSINFEVVSYDG